ncbi:MAG: zinc dependent phospholipase C family protein [Leptonema sp. (in: bacteria)]
MPKEIAHIFFSENILKILRKEIQKIVKENINLYYFGSSSPDLYYYSIPIKRFRHIYDLNVGSKIHDDPNNLSPIHNLLQKAKSNTKEKDKIFSFVAGYLTHVAVDTYYHPYIYSITGHYFDSDIEKQKIYQKNHRIYETCLDLFIVKEFYKISLKELSLKDKLFLQKQQEPILKEYATSIYESFLDKRLSLKEFVDYTYICYRTQKILVSFFLKTKLIHGLRILPWINKRFSSILALCYIEHPEKHQFDFWNLEFQHPINGNKIKTNLDQIKTSIQKRGKRLIEFSYDFVYKDQYSFSQLKEAIPHYSLNTGLISIPNTKMKYFRIHHAFKN